MKYTDYALNVLTANTYDGVKKIWIANNLKVSIPLAKIVLLLAIKHPEITIEDFQGRKFKIEEQLKKANNVDGVVAFGEEDFPHIRKQVQPYDTPSFLFYKGDIRLLNQSKKSVTIVGMRETDASIEEIGKKITKEVLDTSALLITGMEVGCERIAQKCALETNAKMVGVLSSPINANNSEIDSDTAKRILSNGGVLISEFFEGLDNTTRINHRFYDHEKLKAALSDMVILIASYARYTQKNDACARYVLERAKAYGIPIAVVYDAEKNARDDRFDLNRLLLKYSNSVLALTEANSQELISRSLK